MSPDQYVDEDRREDAYKPIARARNLKLKGIVVVRQNSQAERIDDLDQQSLAVPVNAFAADVIPQAVLNNAGVDYTSLTMASQDMVYRAVIAGQVAAGGGTTRTFNAMLPEVRNQLRVLWTSEGYAPHAITAHSRVAPDVVQRVQEALIDLHLDAQGKKMLKVIAPEGLDYARDEDWNELRELGL
jgi:phosphonate transport system substrate-binding protein